MLTSEPAIVSINSNNDSADSEQGKASYCSKYSDTEVF
jgi:hypothetical protein